MSIKDKITPSIKLKFVSAINKTKETGKEHGFFLCKDDKGNLSSSKMRSGNIHNLDLGSPITACPGKMIQGDFHTHAYFTHTKRTSKRIKPGSSDQEIKKFIEDEFEKFKKEFDVGAMTIASPSSKDLLKTILHSCAEISKTSCVGNDVNENVECWTIKDNAKTIDREYCLKAYNELYGDQNQIEPKEKTDIKPNKWVTDLFNIEKIDLRSSSK